MSCEKGAVLSAVSVFSMRSDQIWIALGEFFPTRLFSSKRLRKKQYGCLDDITPNTPTACRDECSYSAPFRRHAYGMADMRGLTMRLWRK
eukprot:1930386-Ditylum_brightwellii.AAC.1